MLRCVYYYCLIGCQAGWTDSLFVLNYEIYHVINKVQKFWPWAAATSKENGKSKVNKMQIIEAVYKWFFLYQEN